VLVGTASTVAHQYIPHAENTDSHEEDEHDNH
jgi:hypothetical protein